MAFSCSSLHWRGRVRPDLKTRRKSFTSVLAAAESNAASSPILQTRVAEVDIRSNVARRFASTGEKNTFVKGVRGAEGVVILSEWTCPGPGRNVAEALDSLHTCLLHVHPESFDTEWQRTCQPAVHTRCSDKYTILPQQKVRKCVTCVCHSPGCADDVNILWPRDFGV